MFKTCQYKHCWHLDMARYKAEIFTVAFEFIYKTRIFYEQEIETTLISMNHLVANIGHHRLGKIVLSRLYFDRFLW